MIARVRQRQRHADDTGMSLVEVIVAMAISTIVLAGVGTVFVGALRTSGVVTARGDQNGNAETAMQTIALKLRSTDVPPDSSDSSAVYEAAYNALTVMAFVQDPALASTLAAQLPTSDDLYTELTQTNQVPEKVRYVFVAASSLCGGKPGITETVTPPVVGGTSTAPQLTWDSTTTTKSRCVLRTVTAPVDTSSPTIGVSPLFRYYSGCAIQPAPAPLTTTPSAVRSVEIRLEASDSSGNLIELINRICLVNLVDP